MKKTLLLLSTAFFSIGAFAQYEVEPYIQTEAQAMFLSGNGLYVCAQDEFGNTLTINTKTHGIAYYAGYYPGNGNCVADNGVVVGQDMLTSVAAVMADNFASIPSYFKGGNTSAFNAITPDCTRACGFVSNTENGPFQIPFYCDLSDGGYVVGEPVILPYPEKDLLGYTPQFITAVCISDDGKTIIGQVMEDTGTFTYPIVFTQAADGTWSYELPSKSLYNPDNLPVPTFPTGSNVIQPDKRNYMSAAEYQDYVNAYNAYVEGLSNYDPDKHLQEYMGDNYESYQAAYEQYVKDLYAYYDEIDQYWIDLRKVVGTNFSLGVMALSPDGKYLATCGIVNDDPSMSDIADAYLMFIFNLEDGTFRTISSKFNNVIPWSILSDGTVVAIDVANYRDFFLAPGAEDYTSFEDFIGGIHPEWLPWLEGELSAGMQVPETGQFAEVISAGVLGFSRDLSVMAGGYNGFYGFFTYIFGEGKAGVEAIGADLTDGRVVVYNLHGVKVLDSRNADDLKTLPAGIYVVNGKKIAIK